MSKGILICLLFVACALAAVPDSRHADPVILQGTQVPELLGQDPLQLVGFRFLESEATWEQIPIQIDEMHIQNWRTIKQDDCRTIGRDVFAHVYADANTYSGPDEDPTFDEDDELVFMARQLGDVKPNGFMNPPGTETGFELVLDIQDPLLGFMSIGTLYIFLNDGSLSQDANAPLIQYELNLSNTNDEGSNSYFDAYQHECTDGGNGYECHDYFPVNPEDTWFRSPHYERHFTENWNTDALHIKVGSSNGENFLNTQDFQFLMFECGRCQTSFVRGRTAFIINKNGPVRGMRSWVGANSGTITQREIHMYEQREDQITYLRVHTIPGIFDYLVYKKDTPLTYYNQHNLQGFTVDGVDDGTETFNNTFARWEVMTGATGTYVRALDVMHNLGDWAHQPNFDAGRILEHWYYDNEVADCDTCGSEGAAVHPNKWHLCSSVYNGITEAWGTHGVRSKPPWYITPNTDPYRHVLWGELPEGACDVEVIEPWLFTFNITYHQYFLAPETDPAIGGQYYSNAVTDLVRNIM